MIFSDAAIRAAEDPQDAWDKVRFSLLGPVQARRGRAELDTGPRQQRSILALLLVRANELVSVQDMIELLWEQEPPGSAVNILHKYVGSIRRLCEPALTARATGAWLTRHGDAYRLAADETTSDLLAFRHLVREARTARSRGRPGDALDLLLEALRLWRGTCGEDLRPGGRTWGYLAAVDQERADAATCAADVALASAQPARMLTPLRRAALVEPLNESLQARLMLVLAATGQQASALSHYQGVRKRLGEELGVDPGSEIRAAHSKVLRQEFPTGVAGPVAQTAAWPSARRPSPLVRPAQLPADLPAFAGRGAALVRLSALLKPGSDAGHRAAICAITGMAGTGKTALAVHLSHHIASRFDDGQLYINLHGFDLGDPAVAPTDALGSLLGSLGVPTADLPAGPDARATMYRSILAGKRLLVLLDNALDAQQVRPLLPGNAACLVVVTSRNPMAGLAMAEGARLFPLDVPSVSEARGILARRLGQDRAGAEPDAVDAIISCCAQWPLALAAVSARIAAHPEFPLAAIAAELQRTPGCLDALAADGLSADALGAFTSSYSHLSPQARRLFRMLPWQRADDVTAATAASLLGLPMDEATGLVAEMISAGLLFEQRPGRYAVHALIRAYAAELAAVRDIDLSARNGRPATNAEAEAVSEFGVAPGNIRIHPLPR